MRKIVLGVCALAAVGGLAACSSGAANNAANLAAATTGSTTTQQASTTPAPVSSNPTTATSTTPSAPSTHTTPPATTKAPAPATQANTTVADGIPCGAAAKACVDLATHTAWILNHGQVVYGPVHAMPGSSSYPTPSGTFHVEAKNEHYFSKEFQAEMPYAVFFYPGDAFHVGSASVPSHGCVHLSWSAAETFYADLSIGDEVQIIR